MSKIAEAAETALDRVAGTCLSRVYGIGGARRREIVLLRRLTIAFAFLLVVVPAALSFVVGPALALPLGVAIALAAFLIAAVVAVAFTSPDQGQGEDARMDDAFDPPPSEFCPGLLLHIDPQGHVLSAGGRDRDVFLACLYDPFGRAFAEQVHVSDRISFLQALDDLRQGADAAIVDLRLGRPVSGRDSSQFMSVRIDMTARHGADGTLAGIVAQILDIAGEMTIRADARRFEGEAVQAHEAKSRFLAAVSHELRTPLNAILGFSDILAGEYFGKLQNDRQREYVQLIRQSGGHLLSVVNAMLDMSRIEAGRYELLLEPFRIDQTVQECESMLSLQAKEKGIALTSRFGRELGEVVADQRAVRQILINLVGNAIKFTETGGAVIIDAGIYDAELKLVVSDTGIGIAPEKMALLGRPFTQIHDDYSRRYEGSGLGLSLVKGLAALHGGRFEVESCPGEGTIVTITLPVDGSGAIAVAEAGDQDNMVEFPPRLKTSAGDGLSGPHGMQEKEVKTDGAKAKIA